MAPQVDEPACLIDPRDKTVLERTLVADERDDRPIVVRVEVGVENAGAGARECVGNRRDDRVVTSL